MRGLRLRPSVSALLVAVAAFGTSVGFVVRSRVVGDAQQLPTELPSTKFSSGQDVVPYFEGWIRNPDGSFDLVFGYFNRNWQEEPAIPVGPDNLIEPGEPDRGQPTYFLPRRQGWVFRVRVPRDFGKQVLTWTDQRPRPDGEGLRRAAAGRGEITERIIMTRGNLNPGEDDPNKPPSVAIAPVPAPAPNAPITLTAMVTDDGLPKPRPALPLRTPAPVTPRRFRPRPTRRRRTAPARLDGDVDAAARACQGDLSSPQGPTGGRRRRSP